MAIDHVLDAQHPVKEQSLDMNHFYIYKVVVKVKLFIFGMCNDDFQNYIFIGVCSSDFPFKRSAVSPAVTHTSDGEPQGCLVLCYRMPYTVLLDALYCAT